ncbi:hypothetical protein DIKCMJMK_02709 [Shewanella oneidensis]|nr:hypothetical protein [Shewanella oneidensis]
MHNKEKIVVFIDANKASDKKLDEKMLKPIVN